MKLLNTLLGCKVNSISTHRAFRQFGVTEPCHPYPYTFLELLSSQFLLFIGVTPHGSILLRDLFPQFVDVFCVCLFVEVSNHILCKPCQKATPKRTRKETQNHWLHGCPTSQNIWYLQHRSHILQFWMCFGIHFVSHRSSDTVFSALSRCWGNLVPE